MARDEMRPLCEPPTLLKDPWDPLRDSKLRERERGESPGIESPARMPSGLYPWVPYVEPSGRGLGRRARRVACSAVEDPAVEVSSAHSVSNRERAEERKECARNTVEDPCSDCARIVEVSSEHPRDIRDTRLPGPSPRPRLGAQMMRGGAEASGCDPGEERRRELPPRLLCGRAGCLNTDLERKSKACKSWSTSESPSESPSTLRTRFSCEQIRVEIAVEIAVKSAMATPSSPCARSASQPSWPCPPCARSASQPSWQSRNIPLSHA